MRPSTTKRPSTTIMMMGHHVKTSDWNVSDMSRVEIRVLLRKEAQDKQIGQYHQEPSTTKRPSATMMVLGHHVKTNDWKVSYMSGVEIHVLLRKEAQDKQIGPVPP